MLDLCCSYGINAALLNHHLTLSELYAHYTGPEAERLTRDELIERDKEFYATRRRADATPVIGLDAAGHAVRYAVAVGLLDEAYAENLEQRPPSPGLRRAVAGAGLITVTGGIGYITHRTFEALLDCAGVPLWVAAFVLRTVSYQPVITCLADHGLLTETAAQTYPQRLFTGPADSATPSNRPCSPVTTPPVLRREAATTRQLYQSRPRTAWAHMRTNS